MGSVELLDTAGAREGRLRRTGIDRLGASWLLDGGRVLVAGGLDLEGERGPAGEVLSVEIEGEEPPRRWSACTARYLHAEVACGEGRWLLAGGLLQKGDVLCATSAVERVDARDRVVEALPGLPFAAAEPLAIPLDGGRVLVAGGYDESTQATAAVSRTDWTGWEPAPPLPAPRAGGGGPIRLDERFVLLAGGVSDFDAGHARDALVLDTWTLKWHAAEIDLPAGAALAGVKGGLLASGGRDGAGEPIGKNTLWTWTVR